MNSLPYKWLISATVFVCLLFLATTLDAKKPIKPPPAPPDEPCSAETFSPDFAFLRNTGKRRSPKVTILLADSTTGCEKSLVDFSIIPPITAIRNLRFSSVEDDGSYFGRTVWTSNIGSQSISVWKQDFNIEGAEIVLDGGSLEVLRNMLLDDPLESENIYSLDMSPDTKTLAYQYSHRYPDPDDVDTNLALRSLRVLKIEACTDPDTNLCEFDDLDNAYAYELGKVVGSTSESVGFTFPSWGPYGERIYVRRNFDAPSLDQRKAIQYFHLEKAGQELAWPPMIIEVSEPLISDIGYFRRIASGLMDGTEYLAIEKEFSEKTGGCEGIYIVNADECLTYEDCLTEPKFAGAYPSWSKDGKLIHAYDGWVPHGNCALSSVGAWNGSDGSLESLFDGYWPDAASGIR